MNPVLKTIELLRAYENHVRNLEADIKELNNKLTVATFLNDVMFKERDELRNERDRLELIKKSQEKEIFSLGRRCNGLAIERNEMTERGNKLVIERDELKFRLDGLDK